MANQQPSQEQIQEMTRQQAQFMAKVWSDADFKRRLISDPAGVMREQGVEVPQGLEIRVVENTPTTVYLVLPPKPSEEISDEQLEQVAGGNTLGSAGSVGSLTTIGTICGTFGTAACAATVGTAGSARV